MTRWGRSSRMIVPTRSMITLVRAAQALLSMRSRARNANEMETRFTELESRHSHLERQFADLSDVVSGQQKAIEALQRDLATFA